MTQVFQNLIGNSIKYGNKDSVAEIEIRVASEGNYWKLSLRDNGIGIEPIFKDKIFLVFQRLHAREEYPGTGIGLAICKKIIEKHNGKIWFESLPGKGTTFFFTLSKELV